MRESPPKTPTTCKGRHCSGFRSLRQLPPKGLERVLPLVTALRRRGLSAWLDQSEIGEFAPITDKIRQGLAESKALLAWYSAEYPQSRPCQMELTAAFLAAQHEGDPRQRILVINPTTSVTHIEPVELRDAQYAAAPVDAAATTRSHGGSLPT
jgi:hypothetical protein